ncbi:MAG: hypothetical protein HRT87_12525, partial [Legionellales bacterium]|nr:hypothetical protein [Legionellales bacterium]
KENVVSNIFDYLEIENDTDVLKNYQSQNLNGTMGDKNINTIKNITFDENKWKKIIKTDGRKDLLLQIIRKIDLDYFNITLIEKNELLTKIYNHNTKFNISDFKDFHKNNLRRKLKNIIKWNRY